MNRSPDASARRRTDAYFTASFEVARRLAEGRGDEAIAVLRRELDRLEGDAESTGRRFLLSQIALCFAKMGDFEQTARTLEQLEESLPHDADTAILLSEGYLLLLENGERAAHHAGCALKWLEEAGEDTPEGVSRARNLMARALVASSDLVGAFSAWEACPLPGWQAAVDLIEGGYNPLLVKRVLVDALPRLHQHERRQGAEAVASTDRVRRLIAWIDAGCPENS
ncbi:MAG: hypothetical protein HC882_01205 [Acidobacteria bacterium]|nr:hypothetical protein [Acidobacteriota bacterium]